MIKTALAFGLVAGLASAAVAQMPVAQRDNTPITGNEADFRSDARFGYWDIDGTATTPDLSNGQQAGFLANKYNLTPLDPPGPATSNNVLTQLERAVVEFQAGSAVLGDPNSRTYGVHTPNTLSGQPISDGGIGVFNSLTDFATLNADSSPVSTTNQINVPWQNFVQSNGADLMIQPPPVVFSISRAGTMLSVQITDGQGIHNWSSTSNAFADINAFQLRMAAGGTSVWRITDLRYNGDLLNSTTTSGPTSTYQADTFASTAAFSEREIFLWDQVSGDFSLTGNIFLGWRLDNRPTGSTANLQLRFLDITSDPIPEPASWAMMIAGFGLVGASLRRRRTMVA